MRGVSRALSAQQSFVEGRGAFVLRVDEFGGRGWRGSGSIDKREHTVRVPSPSVPSAPGVYIGCRVT